MSWNRYACQCVAVSHLQRPPRDEAAILLSSLVVPAMEYSLYERNTRCMHHIEEKEQKFGCIALRPVSRRPRRARHDLCCSLHVAVGLLQCNDRPSRLKPHVDQCRDELVVWPGPATHPPALCRHSAEYFLDKSAQANASCDVILQCRCILCVRGCAHVCVCVCLFCLFVRACESA